MTTKPQTPHCVVTQPVNNLCYDRDNEYIHNTDVDSQ